MNDLRSEIRDAFQKEQAQNPPAANLRQTVTQAVAAQPQRKPNLQWVAVAAAILLAALVVAGLMSTRLANRSSVPAHPKAVVSPSPVGDYGPPPAGVPLFYLQDPNHKDWYLGFDWNGAPRGTIKLAQPLDQTNALVQAPDGSAFQVKIGAKGGGETLLDRLGNPIPGTGGIWADDNTHTCGMAFDQQKYTWTLETGGVGQATRPVALIATDSGVGQTGISLAACSFKNDRAIAVRTTVSWPSEMWVVRLSDGKVLAHSAFKDQLGYIVASPDGAILAENSRQSVGIQGGLPATAIRRLSDGAVLTTLDPAFGVIAFSADNSLALVTTSTEFAGMPTHLAVVEVATGKVIWRYDGSDELAGFLTEPTGAAFALMLKTPSSAYAHPDVSVVMVFIDGRSSGIPGRFVRP